MKIKFTLAALPLILSFAMSAAAQARGYENRAHWQGYGIVGREVAAPPWSFACVNDQGLRQCDEPMWVYGSPREVSRYKSAF